MEELEKKFKAISEEYERIKKSSSGKISKNEVEVLIGRIKSFIDEFNNFNDKLKKILVFLLFL